MKPHRQGLVQPFSQTAAKVVHGTSQTITGYIFFLSVAFLSSQIPCVFFPGCQWLLEPPLIFLTNKFLILPVLSLIPGLGRKGGK